MMSNQNVTQKLNSKLALLDAEISSGKKKIAQSITFECGNLSSELAKVVFNKCPSGKVCVLCTKSSYSRYGVDFQNQISMLGLECVNVIMTEEQVDSVDRLSNIFNVGDDVRVVLTFNYSLFGAVSYFASVRNIHSVCVVDSFCVDGILNSTITLKNGEYLDEFSITCSKTIYLKDKFTQGQNKGSAYAFVMAHLTSLIDYRIASCCFAEQFSKPAYTLARDSVYSAYGVFKGDAKEQEDLLLYAQLLLELANYLSGGNLKKVSATEWAKKLVCQDQKAPKDIGFFVMIAVIKIYDALFNASKISLLEYPDYLQIAEDISKVYPQKVDDIAKNLIEQATVIRKKKLEISSLLQKLKVEVGSLAKFADAMRQTYFALGGTEDGDAQILSNAIKYSGDLTPFVNGVALLREQGVTNLM